MRAPHLCVGARAGAAAQLCAACRRRRRRRQSSRSSRPEMKPAPLVQSGISFWRRLKRKRGRAAPPACWAHDNRQACRPAGRPAGWLAADRFLIAQLRSSPREKQFRVAIERQMELARRPLSPARLQVGQPARGVHQVPLDRRARLKSSPAGRVKPSASWRACQWHSSRARRPVAAANDKWTRPAAG